MKISNHQFLNAFLLGAGLIAIYVAYQANSKNATSDDLFFAGSSEIQLNDPSVGSMSGLDVDGYSLPDRELTQPEFASLPSVEVETAPEASRSQQQWIDDSDLKVEVENEVLKIAQSRELDAFENLDSAAETQIPAKFDGASEAEPVSFVEQAPPVAPDLTQVPVALDDAAAFKAVHRIEYGKSLARRNASEAASQEFLGALRVLAESNDAAAGGDNYITALRRGLQAMKEAADFKVDDPRRQITLEVASVIEGHQTKIIGARQAQGMTATVATRRYLEFAGIQLGTCGGQNPVAAEALYCLGKMRTISAQSNPDPESTDLYEAIIFQHAALTADPKNHRSANELGVLLARNGQLDAAETYLKNSLRLKQTPQGWANLAKVHQRKGTSEDQRLATLAMNEYQTSLYRQAPSMNDGPIQLVGAQEFVARSPVQHPNAAQTMASPQLERIPVNVPVESKPSMFDRVGSFFNPNKSTR